MGKKKVKVRQPRNWLAVSAQFRNSAGALKEKPAKKKRDIYKEIMEGIDEMKKQREREDD